MRPYPGRWILALLIGLGTGELSAAPGTPVTVVAVQVRGTVEVQHGAEDRSEPVAEGAQLGVADTISTGAKSSVTLVIPNGSVVALKERSRLKIAVALQSPLADAAPPPGGTEPPEPGVSRTGFELAFGEMLTRVRKLNPTSTFTVQTPVSVAAVRGTVFEISFQPGAGGEAHYRLSTASGLVQVTPHAGREVAVPANEQVDLTAELGKNGVKIKQLKASKLDRKKSARIQAEALDNERNAGEVLSRVFADGAGARAKAALEKAGTETRTDATDRVTPPPTKPKIPPRVKAIKRPPRRPGN